nr:hypothetical protein [Tanacetum cinerariifolium]
QTSSAGATQQLSSGNTSSLAVAKYSSSGIFITGGGNDLSILFPTIHVEDSDSFMEEINLSFTPNDSMPSSIENDDYDSKVDMLILEGLVNNDSLSLPENESFHFDIPSSSRPPTKPPDDDSRILTVKVVDDISEHDVPMPRLLPIQTTLVSNQEKSPHFLSHRGLKASKLHSESPMMSYEGNTPILDVSFLHFYPP